MIELDLRHRINARDIVTTVMDSWTTRNLSIGYDQRTDLFIVARNEKITLCR
jgi:hypothetical protein